MHRWIWQPTIEMDQLFEINELPHLTLCGINNLNGPITGEELKFKI